MKPSFPQQIDNTIRGTWKSCDRKCYLRHWHGWQPRGPESIHLHAGGAFARGLEVTRRAFYQEGLDPDLAIGLGWQALQQHYTGDYTESPHESWRKSAKTPTRMGEALVSYFDEYPLETDHVQPAKDAHGSPAVEFTFSIPLPINSPETGEPILYTGRFDMLGQSTGKLWVVDEKTTGALGEFWAQRYKLGAQFTGYCWAAKMYGYPVVGALIRGIGILKYDIKHAEVPLFRPDYLIEEWYQQLLIDVQEMVDAWIALTEDCSNEWSPLIFRPDYNDACGSYGGCDFLPVCGVMPEARGKMLDANFEKRLWVPLHGAEYDE